jgi:hypothetical protein
VIMVGSILIAVLLASSPASGGPRSDHVAAVIPQPAAIAPPALTGGDPEPADINAPVQVNRGAIDPPPPEAFPADMPPIRDRWRLAASLGLVKPRWLDPYNQNTLKGDRPILGTQDVFLNLSLVSDTVLEPRSFPTPVAANASTRPGQNDSFGRVSSFLGSQTFLLGASIIKGATAFKPPDFELRVNLAYNYNYAEVPERQILNIASSRSSRRTDDFLAVQEGYFEYHLRNVSDRYDFDAVRVGIQPFISDFRGFLFQDDQLGVRFFGNRDNNRFQYNLAVFQRIEKDTNSGLNDLTVPLRRDTIFVANAYRQDLPVPGMTSQVTVIYDRDRERKDVHFDTNGFPVRPALIGVDRGRDYDVVYAGFNLDGHFGRLNLTASTYAAFGEDRNNPFTGKPSRIESYFVAAEPSIDFSWARVRLSGLYASGDKSPFGKTETGFDAILENPQFAGSDTSYWIRQSIPFVGGGLVSINGRNGVLNDLRSSKDEGQSNFVNPGTILLGVGTDLDLTPTIRASANINNINFVNTEVIQALRQQGRVQKGVGMDYSASIIWRPLMTQNIVLRGSAAIFEPGAGFRDLLTARGADSRFYSILFNCVLSY